MRPSAPPLELRLFGHLEISIDGVPVDLSRVRPRARSTLRLLALRAGSSVHRDALVSDLWPDVDLDSALRSLQVAVSSLRGVLARPADPVDRGRNGLLIRNGESYGLELPPGGRCDVREFEVRLTEARAHRLDGGRKAERMALQSALALYRGNLLLEEGTAEWVVAERDRLLVAAASAWQAFGRCLAESGEHDEAVEAVRTCLRLDPYADNAWRLLVDLHAGAGNPAAARAATLEHRRVLAELGIAEPADASSSR